MRLTLAIPNYNAEKYIGEAIDGAFAQTYPELDILISDDCSTDRSWEIIQQKVAAYKGPHRVILNRNEPNLGIGRHVGKLFELCQTDWIVMQGGDDVSLPNRVQQIADAIARDPSLRCLESHVRAVKSDGRTPCEIPKSLVKDEKDGRKSTKFQLPSILGAGGAYHRDVFLKFGPLGARVSNEDHVLPLRAALLGTIDHLSGIAVNYRKHGENQSGAYVYTPESVARYRQRMMHMYYQELSDLLYAEQNGFCDIALIDRYRKCVIRQLQLFQFLARWQLVSSHRLQMLLALPFKPGFLCFLVVRAVGRIKRRYL